ncbi:MAG: hypothetical protein Hyperionvirus7_57 [Hyperionvirus sp.]|uniref:DUF5672 domain-containing protein n=1 Tax=Hyperionvirus sp. TaxID=2487770 RepID=A0A3G5A882_9VIRU|nr:MAG: hypothetical protein Hyperionvirus7_57 [Hyperionvirus sp.]
MDTNNSNNENNFDWQFYLSKYKDLRDAGINTKEAARTHWHNYGNKERRSCVKPIDWEFYLSKYKDLRDAGINTKEAALIHWHTHGKNEGRFCVKPIDKFIYELYIRELTDKTIDTFEKAQTHYNTNRNSSYVEKMELMDKLNVCDINYYYELKDFIKEYSEYCFIGKSEVQIFDTIESEPKIGFRYFCYRYINYMRNFNVPDIAVNSKKEAVLVEFRKFPHLEFLIRNTIRKLSGDWSHTIICGRDNYEYIKLMCETISDKITVKKLDYGNVTPSQYSLLLTSKEFWNRLTGKKILIYQEDSCIFKSNIEDFLVYDYIGAPWPIYGHHNSYSVGNGGISLRSKQVMLKIIERISLASTKFNANTVLYMKGSDSTVPPEDVYFSKNMIDFKLGKIADRETANKFAVETQYNDSPFSGHQFWLAIKNWKAHLYKYVVSC